MAHPLAGSKTFNKRINLALRPSHRTNPDFYGTREYPELNQFQESAALVAYAVKNFRETAKTIFLIRQDFHMDLYREFPARSGMAQWMPKRDARA